MERGGHASRLPVGNYADLVLFNLEAVGETATYTEPHQFATGISHAFVNGRLVIQDGEHTDVLAGRVLRRGSR